MWPNTPITTAYSIFVSLPKARKLPKPTDPGYPSTTASTYPPNPRRREQNRGKIPAQVNVDVSVSVRGIEAVELAAVRYVWKDKEAAKARSL